MRLVVATHGHCFDGLASAALFTRLITTLEEAPVEATYRACGYGVTQRKAKPSLFDGASNAILDYRYCATPKLDWYFDHHKTAFGSAAERRDFEQRVDDGQFFFDDEYSSCTKLIADVGRERFGLSLEGLEELVRWADRVDSAGFASADEAISRSEPVMRLVTVVEHHGDDRFLTDWVPQLLERPLSEVAADSRIQERYAPLGAKHDRFVERVRESAREMGRVVFVDLTADVVETVGKFVTYGLFPKSVYSVIVGKMKSGIKISVGYNPWCGVDRDTDISEICARHGGGGHPAVGGIAFPTERLDHALETARGIVRELEG